MARFERRGFGGRSSSFHERVDIPKPVKVGEEYDVDGADRFRIVGRRDLFQMEIALHGFDPQAAGLHGLEVGAASHERDLSTGCLEARAEIPADAARADDRNSQDGDYRI